MADFNYKPLRNDSLGNKFYSLENEMGFAKRDLYNTLATDTPIPVYPLGMKNDKIFNLHGPDHTHTARYAVGALPGIMTFQFEPVLSTPMLGGDAGNAQAVPYNTFVNLHNEIRSYYTGANNFQPADLHMSVVIMSLLKMYIALVEKYFDTYFAVDSANNVYTRGEILRTAHPFGKGSYGHESDLDALIRRWNTYVIAPLNQKEWFTGLIPGEDRWASLVEGYYRDVDDPSGDYSQLYTMYPRSVYNLIYTSETGYSLGRQLTSSFNIDTFITMVSSFVSELIDDEDFNNIQQAIRTYKLRTRNDSVETVTGGFNMYPAMGRSIELLYNQRKLIAWHNATILHKLTPGDATCNPREGWLVQNWTNGTQPDTSMKNTIELCDYAYNVMNKVLNLYSVAPSIDEVLNATQWVQCREQSVDMTDGTYPPELLGSDVITAAYIITAPDSVTEFYPVDVSPIGTTIRPTEPTFDSKNGDFLNVLNQIVLRTKLNASAASFDFAPICYLMQVYYEYANHPVHQVESPFVQPHGLVVTGLRAQMEIPFVVNYDMLSTMKVQWMRNFYGYPMYVQKVGTFEMADNASTSVPAASVTSNTINPIPTSRGAEQTIATTDTNPMNPSYSSGESKHGSASPISGSGVKDKKQRNRKRGKSGKATKPGDGRAEE